MRKATEVYSRIQATTDQYRTGTLENRKNLRRERLTELGERE
jgi:hypothetical protein